MVRLLRRAAGYVTQAKVPLPDRLQMFNLLLRLGVDQVLAPGFLQRVDLEGPARDQREVWASVRQGSEGRATNSAAGAKASVKRSAASSSGGKWASAALMTTKLVPHTATTASASSAWRQGRAALTGLPSLFLRALAWHSAGLSTAAGGRRLRRTDRPPQWSTRVRRAGGGLRH